MPGVLEMPNRGLSGSRSRSEPGRVLRRVGGRRSDVLVGAAGNRSLDDVLFAVERREILAALARAMGQRTKAAELLGISRSRLYRRMEALGIEPTMVRFDGRP